MSVVDYYAIQITWPLRPTELLYAWWGRGGGVALSVLKKKKVLTVKEDGGSLNKKERERERGGEKKVWHDISFWRHQINTFYETLLMTGKRVLFNCVLTKLYQSKHFSTLLVLGLGVFMPTLRCESLSDNNGVYTSSQPSLRVSDERSPLICWDHMGSIYKVIKKRGSMVVQKYTQTHILRLGHIKQKQTKKD